MNWRTLPSFARAGVRVLRHVPSFAAASVALTLVGCTVNAHSEWHTGSGGDTSSGAEGREQHGTRSTDEHEGRHSDAGRDHAVRVTTTDKHVEQSGDSGGRSHSGHHPTGPAPEGSSGASDGNASGGGAASNGAGDAAATAGTSDNSGSASGSSEAQPASSDQASDGGKGTLKHENEPHVAKPVRRRGAHKGETRTDPEGTKKTGGHE